MQNSYRIQSAAFWRKFQRDRDFLTATCFVAVACVLIIGTADLRSGPRALPRLMGWCIAFCGVVLSVQAALRIRKGKGAPKGSISARREGENWFVRVLPLTGLVMSYFIIPIAGFYTAIGMYVFLLHIHLSRIEGSRKWWKGMSFTLIVMAVLYVFFRILLFVRTPTGFLV